MSDDPFQPRDPSDVLALVRACPLAWVIARGGDPAPTPLPLLAECDGDGRISALFGHMARRNPLHAALDAAPQALVLFQGPQAYVPPRLVSKPDWGPTWNYAVARFTTRVEFVPDETDAALRQLAAHLEAGQPDPWTVDRMGPRYAQLKTHIIAFRAHVEHVHATFKLGQDESPDSLAEILAGHPDVILTEWMRRQRPQD
ncbi:FMN-binding negative transcriptional regulator [Luteimonas kalidii]|uniref:FMN-binding negative transcriptional regulator n=1 Tax=Luteimonas kalidii TaxID=3042025 RepID=A0ABT6JNW9_9GAMM|nr:FMN-binding negative transcriptional regulator [Luteimonas kalidii]MDH5832388.1 FMN-binding negative transcriptional regulator [Luteimonas kalidii]